MRFPPSFLDRVRSAFLLSELIGKRVPLKKQGREHTGLCPFHGEKTPSFTVNDAKGFFHCFGCGAHGDAIGFVQRMERLSFPEAVEWLARAAGVPLPEITPEAQAREDTLRVLYDACEAACRWFESNLSAAEHFAVRDYVSQRGISAATLQAFRIGFAPDAREGLKCHLLGKGYSEPVLLEAGLLARTEDGPSYDRFRARLIFPIRDARGRVIAFGGRLIARDAPKHLPKYLNTAETPLFHKGEILFHIDRAAPVARERKEIIVVEGYMDAVTLAQAGFVHTVAPLGTAITPEHLRLLWRYAPEPLLCLDGDAAGARAMLRAAELALPLLTPGHSLRFVSLPRGEDPDSLIKHGGAAALEAAIKTALPLSEALWRHQATEGGNGAEARASRAAALEALAQKIQDPTVRSHFRSFFREKMWTRHDKPSRTGLSEPRPGFGKALLTLVFACPEILDEPDAEEFLGSLEELNEEECALRESLLEAWHAGLPLPSCPWPVRPMETENARQEWRQLRRAGHLRALEQEHEALSHAEPDAETMRRLSALQLEIRRCKDEVHS